MLKSRVTDTNKAVQTLALDIVARIATGMGKPFDKQTKFFVVPVASVLSDQKAPIRASALATLTAIATACEGMDALVHWLTTALEVNNPVQRSNLLNWIAGWFKEHEMTPGIDLGSWVPTVVSCLDDRSADVRKGAQAVLPFLIASAGFDKVMAQTNNLKPASKASAVPFINAARASAPSSSALSAAPAAAAPAAAKSASAAKAAPPKPIMPSSPPSSAASTLPPSPTSAAPPASKVAPASKLTGIRRKLPQGTISRPESRAESVDEAPTSRLPGKPGSGFGLRRPGMPVPSALKTAPPPATATSPPPAMATGDMAFTGMNVDAKRSRLAKDPGKWINEAGTTRKDLADLLQHQMEPYASRDLVAQLFSTDHNAVNDHVAGLATIAEFYGDLQAGDEKFGLSAEELKAVGIANSDLALKYVSIKAHEPQSNLIAKSLDAVDSVLAFLRSIDYQLSDNEALCFIPTMIYKVRTDCLRRPVGDTHLSL